MISSANLYRIFHVLIRPADKPELENVKHPTVSMDGDLTTSGEFFVIH
jgi:hypothetical protein